jgi:hypothetical protein avisC_07922
MRLLRRRPPSAALPSRLAGLVPGSEPVLGAVPLDEEGRRWAVATSGSLMILDEGGVDTARTWDGVTRGAWDAEERTFTLELLHEAEPLVLSVPERIPRVGRDGDVMVAEKAFAVALRQRIDAAIIHHVSDTLPSGRRATASVRRRADGSLYSVTDPPLAGEEPPLDADDADALGALERRARDGVGLPTP